MKKILAVFPGDALKTFYDKGEVKERYYNPDGFFDEVHFYTFTESEVEPEKVRKLVGSAEIFIHPLGKLKPWSIWTDKNKVFQAVASAKPSAIRAFTPSAHGFFAAYCAKRLGIPFVISIHGDFDRDVRYFYWKMGQWKIWLQSEYMKLFTERYAISNADEVICAYNFPVQYAKAYGAKNITVIYNKVYAKNFSGIKPALRLPAPAAICVGRLIPEKNQECLIRAISILKNKGVPANAIIIGNGVQREYLARLTRELKVEKEIVFFKSVPNSQIPSYYRSAQIFALPIKYGGVAIPVIEAMAAGLPVVVARPELDPNPELASEVGMVIDNTPGAFADSIQKIISSPSLRKKMQAAGFKKFAEIEGLKMEKLEASVYRRALGARK